jgi:ATP-dependent Clp protease ATP-binding subunit ClpC
MKVSEIIGTGSGELPHHLPFTPRAKKILEMSLRESLQLGHNYIGTEHITLGLLREGEGVAAQVLEHSGIDLEATRVEVARLLGVDPGKIKSPSRSGRRARTSQCTHPAEDLEVRPADGFRTVRCRRCGLLVGVLPAA